MKVLKEFLTRFHNAGLKASLSKCSFGLRSCEYLGFILNETGFSVSPERIEALLNAPIPTNSTKLKGFLGSLVMIRRFSSEFAELLAPLNACSKPDKFDWGG